MPGWSATGSGFLVPRTRVFACAAVSALTAAVAFGQDLERRIETAIGGIKIGDGRVGICVIDLQTGRTLVSRNADTPFIPASNMKLLTTGTALTVLGGDFAFRTELLLDGTRLIVRGAGDPALADPSVLERMTPPLSVRQLVATLADAVRRTDTGHVTELILDDRVFDRQFVHPAWPADQLHKWYCAEVSGLNFHTNCLSFFPAPSPDGQGRPPLVTLQPDAPWVEIENKARTGVRNDNSVWVQRSPGPGSFTLFGEVGVASRVAVDVAIHDVPQFFGRLLTTELLRAGVGVGQARTTSGAGNPTREELSRAFTVIRAAEPGERLDRGRVVAAVSTHIADVYQRTNSDSQNLYAECLLKRVGREVTGEPGSWTNGASIVRMTLAQVLGPDAAAATVVSDGSGMSRENQVSPRTLTRWLEAMQAEPRNGEAFVSSLAVPGEGTLRSRFRSARLGSELQAKSGKIDGVRCLSGYLTDATTGRRVAFSIMVNDLREGEQALQSLRLHEEVVKAIDQWLVARRSGRSAVPGGG